MSRLVKVATVSAMVAVGTAALTGSAGYGHVKPCSKKAWAPGKPKCKFKAYPTIQYTNQDPGSVPPGAGPPPPPAEDPTDFFAGGLTVKPGGSACLSGRTVQVVRVADDVVIGETTTLNDGTWKVPAEDVAAGQYRAKTKNLNVTLTIPPVPGVSPGHKHTFICVGAHSGPPITAGP